jgi:serine phosphatase RsbU (regulator of sigma subunit)
MAPLNGGPRRELFGLDRLDHLLLTCKPHSAHECVREVRAAVAQFGDNAVPSDDQTLIAIRSL